MRTHQPSGANASISDRLCALDDALEMFPRVERQRYVDMLMHQQHHQCLSAVATSRNQSESFKEFAVRNRSCVVTHPAPLYGQYDVSSSKTLFSTSHHMKENSDAMLRTQRVLERRALGQLSRTSTDTGRKLW